MVSAMRSELAILLFTASWTVLSCSWFSAAPTEKTSPPPSPLPELPQVQVPLAEEPVIPLSSLMPYFDDVAGGVAARALAEDRLEDAIAGFDAIASDFGNPDIALRADFLAAYLSYYNGDDARPLQRLPELAALLPVLSDVAWEVAGLAAFRAGQYPQAIALAERITRDSMTRQMLLADAHRRQGHVEESLSLYRQAAMRWSSDDRHHEARARIVECIHSLSMKRTAPADLRADISPPAESTDNTTPSFAAEREALDIIEALVAVSPTDYWTRHAVRLEEALLAQTGTALPEKKKESPLAMELFEQAHADMKKRRNARAKERYEKAIRSARDGGDLQCQARYELALTVSFLRRHGEAADLFMEAAQHCDSPRLKIRSLYKGGEASMAADRFLDAIRLFGQVEELFPEHSFADDARLHAARAHLAMGQPDEFMRLVASIPEDYPDGDMCGEALWQGARHTMDRGEPEKALDLLSRYYSLFPIEPGWYTAGRSGYWLARLEEQLGSLNDAISHYEYVIATAPLSYYMVLSYARLRELDSTRTELLLAQLAPATGSETDGIPARLVTSLSRFALGVELVRLGLLSRGKKVLQEELQRPDSHPELHRAAAALFRNAGRFTESREFSSSSADGWSERYPAGSDFASWSLAYPKAHEELVTAAAGESGVDPALLWAVMREESGFNATIESWANAVGLMQLILPTARAMGQVLGLEVTKESLKDPGVNIRLGAAYLAHLQTLFNENDALVIAGYNAGSGAVSKWLKASGDAPLDLFVERIPYSQTRGYTKRVLASYAVYQFLYSPGQSLPDINFNLN